MDPLMLETLMKLASAGTSGVCILAIFWSGYSLQRMPPGAPVERHRSLRHFMTVALAVAIVSASAASVNAYFNYHQIVDLRDKVETLAAGVDELQVSKFEIAGELAETQVKYKALNQEYKATLQRFEIQPPPWDNEETRDPGSQ